MSKIDATDFFLLIISFRLRMQIVPIINFSNIYINNLSDPSFTGTALSCDVEHELHMYYFKTQRAKRFVSAPVTNSYYTIGFLYPNLWDERLEEIIEGLITGGIIDWYFEKYTKSKWNTKAYEAPSKKVVLNLSHLGFGFQICFYVLYVAFLKWIQIRRSTNRKVNVIKNSSLEVLEHDPLCLENVFGEKIDFVLEYLEEFEQIVKESEKYNISV